MMHNPISFLIFLCVLGANTVSFSSEPAEYSGDEYYKKKWETQKPKIMRAIAQDDKAFDRPEFGEWGCTPLCRAIEGNDLELVTFLLQKGADPNKEIKSAPSSRPIFFANSLEMVQFLQANGASIYVSNQGTGICRGMTFIHKAINWNTEDDRLFEHALNHKFDPKILNENGGNLWHSLIHISACSCPEGTFMKRAKLLHTLGVDPRHKDSKGRSAIDIVKNEVADETAFLNGAQSEAPEEFEREFGDRIAIRNKLQRFVECMITGSYVVKK